MLTLAMAWSLAVLAVNLLCSTSTTIYADRISHVSICQLSVLHLWPLTDIAIHQWNWPFVISVGEKSHLWVFSDIPNVLYLAICSWLSACCRIISKWNRFLHILPGRYTCSRVLSLPSVRICHFDCHCCWCCHCLCRLLLFTIFLLICLPSMANIWI